MASFDSSRTAGAASLEFSIDNEVAVMKTRTVNQLAQKYAEVCGYPARSRNKQWLIKRIAWQIQANREGGLSERALARAAELAKGAQLRMLPPREPKASPPAPKQTTVVPCTLKSNARLPFPGSVLTRDYKGQRYIVSVLRNGFELEGTVYPSLTAVAKAITGKHWNGYHFFGLDQQGGAT
jgi:Protein of unknown function (DUF2924)